MATSPSKKQLREFGYLIGFAFPLLLGWAIPAVFGHGFRPWTLWIGAPALILGVIAPSLLRLPYNAWMALGHALGWINSHIILGLVFLLVVQPIAYIMRAFGYDPLKRRIDPKTSSYREKRETLATNFNRIF